MASIGHGDADLPGERIRQLNEIDMDVVELLKSAGAAVKTLTTLHVPSDDTNNLSQITVDPEQAFRDATSQYFTLLSSVDVRLRRQIYALEDAQIIPAEAKIKDTADSQTGSTIHAVTGDVGPVSKQSGTSKGTVTGGGLGNLDVGWLNSRNDRVGKEMEAELWLEAQHMVQRIQQSLKESQSKLEGDHEMQVSLHTGYPQNELKMDQV